jgi:hypothetical protein
MVMKSFTKKSMTIPIDPTRIEEYRTRIKERFHGHLEIRFEGNSATIEGDILHDYRVTDWLRTNLREEC